MIVKVSKKEYAKNTTMIQNHKKKRAAPNTCLHLYQIISTLYVWRSQRWWSTSLLCRWPFQYRALSGMLNQCHVQLLHLCTGFLKKKKKKRHSSTEARHGSVSESIGQTQLTHIVYHQHVNFIWIWSTMKRWFEKLYKLSVTTDLDTPLRTKRTNTLWTWDTPPLLIVTHKV